MSAHKDHIAFLLKVKYSKRNSCAGRSVCYLGIVDVGRKWPERVTSQCQLAVRLAVKE